MSWKRLAMLAMVVSALGWVAWASADTPTFTVEGPAQALDDAAALTPQGAVTVLSDGFEGAFPGTRWKLSGTQPTWGLTTKLKHAGKKSIYCAKGGTGGVDWPGPYKRNQNSWAIQGPFNLTGATGGKIGGWFNYDLPGGTTQTDYLFLGASVDGTTFYGYYLNGNSAGAWKNMYGGLGRLKNQPLGKSKVWFAYAFFSNGDAVKNKGVLVDDAYVTITKAAGASVAVNAAAVPTAMGAQVSVSLTSAAAVSVSICNIAGREVAALPPADLPAGVSTLLWNGLSANGTKAPPGQYLVRVTARSAGGGQANALTTLMLGP